MRRRMCGSCSTGAARSRDLGRGSQLPDQRVRRRVDWNPNNCGREEVRNKRWRGGELEWGCLPFRFPSLLSPRSQELTECEACPGPGLARGAARQRPAAARAGSGQGLSGRSVVREESEVGRNMDSGSCNRGNEAFALTGHLWHAASHPDLQAVIPSHLCRASMSRRSASLPRSNSSRTLTTTT